MSDVTLLAAALRSKLTTLAAPPAAPREEPRPDRDRRSSPADKGAVDGLRAKAQEVVAELQTRCPGMFPSAASIRPPPPAPAERALQQRVMAQAEAEHALRRELAEAAAERERVSRAAAEKDRLLRAIYGDIDRLKATVAQTQEAFQQTRAELRLSRAAHGEQLKAAQQQRAEAVRREAALAAARRATGESEERGLQLGVRLNETQCRLATLERQAESLRQEGRAHEGRAQEAQRLCVELHTRVAETRSRYETAESLLDGQLRAMEGLVAEHGALIQLYRAAETRRDEARIEYLEPCGGETTGDPDVSGSPGTSLGQAHNAVPEPSVGSKRARPPAAAGPRRSPEAAVSRGPSAAHAAPQDKGLCGRCQEPPYGLMVGCLLCARDFHSACAKQELNKAGADGSNERRGLNRFTCMRCSDPRRRGPDSEQGDGDGGGGGRVASM